MRHLLKHYLNSLKEEGELDRICVEMLEDLGLTVDFAPQKGTRQYGVDILAHGIMPGESEEKAYALIVKAKDIDRQVFDEAETGVAVSIRECVNVYERNCMPEGCRSLPLVVCIVCGGEIKFEVSESLVSLEEAEFKWAKERKGIWVTGEQWNGDTLAGKLIQSLDNLNILIAPDKRLMSRAIALADDPSSSFVAFKAFANSLLKDNGISESVLLRHLHSLNLAVAMLFEECESDEISNREAAWLAVEYAYLREWEFIQRTKVGKRIGKRQNEALEDIARLYCRIADSYIDRISLFVKERYGFALAVDGYNEVDVILRFYDTLGKLASYGLYQVAKYTAKSEQDEKETSKAETASRINKIATVMSQMLIGNAAAATPLLDSESNAIAMALLFLAKVGCVGLARDWIKILIGGLFASFGQGYGYPVASLGYKELMEHMHSGAGDPIDKKLPSTELLPMIASVSLKLDVLDAYEKVCELIRHLPQNINYQAWFLDEDSENEFFSGKPLCGSQLCSLPISEKSLFVEMLAQEKKASPVALSCCKTAHEGLLFIGCRHYGYPLPGNFIA